MAVSLVLCLVDFPLAAAAHEAIGRGALDECVEMVREMLAS